MMNDTFDNYAQLYFYIAFNVFCTYGNVGIALSLSNLNVYPLYEICKF